MAGPLVYAAAAGLALHGVVHVLGSGVYLGVFELATFEYKTTVLAGAVDVGDTGTRVFGVLWAVAAVGFAASAVGLLTSWEQWRPLLATVTLLSVVLTGLDVDIAYAGLAVNLAILAGLVALPRL